MSLMEHGSADPRTLQAADYNPRQITAAQYDALKFSLEKFGFVQPVVINNRTGRVVGGHQRIKAAIDIGITSVPTVTLDLDNHDEKALNLALNRVGGDWDDRLLTKMLADLGSEGWDLADLGFDDTELDRLLNATTTEPEPGSITDIEYEESYHLIIECSSVDEQGEVMAYLDKRGIECRPLIS
ncbi:MAG: putative ParB [Prokaryotic dsDNA virus sp.]|nr:MAG: putative ParB [Prokaryotic dsDNA virus sp.]|tara:strand:- start:3722 stop:4273 length:552 start_codon:yes stop_codon:yes gene_type:complete